jgi:hypothetical protein
MKPESSLAQIISSEDAILGSRRRAVVSYWMAFEDGFVDAAEKALFELSGSEEMENGGWVGMCLYTKCRMQGFSHYSWVRK